jgi:hypothetical protein
MFYIANRYSVINSSRKERSMNKRLILLIGGILLVVTFLVGTIWGWVAALAFLIGVFLITLIVLARYASLKQGFNPLQSPRTLFYSEPIWWGLYRMVYPHNRNQSRDLDDLFPSQKTPGPDESEELLPFSFSKATEEQRESNTEEHKNSEPL